MSRIELPKHWASIVLLIYIFEILFGRFSADKVSSFLNEFRIWQNLFCSRQDKSFELASETDLLIRVVKWMHDKTSEAKPGDPINLFSQCHGTPLSALWLGTKTKEIDKDVKVNAIAFLSLLSWTAWPGNFCRLNLVAIYYHLQVVARTDLIIPQVDRSAVVSEISLSLNIPLGLRQDQYWRNKAKSQSTKQQSKHMTSSWWMHCEILSHIIPKRVFSPTCPIVSISR